MSFPFCNVALPVPLRTVFTYAIPEALCEFVQPGSRVVVPFRNKSLVGLVVECVQHAPPTTKIREIAKTVDLVPALTAKLVELGRWIAGYYVAPLGEVFRAMLPPVTELRSERQIILSESGRVAIEAEIAGVHSLDPEANALLSHLRIKGAAIPTAAAAKFGVDSVGLQRLRRAGFIEIR